MGMPGAKVNAGNRRRHPGLPSPGPACAGRTVDFESAGAKSA